MPTRRDVLRAGLIAGGALMLPRWARAKDGFDFPSPFLRPFALDLPIPPVPKAIAPFSSYRDVPAGAVYHEMRGLEAEHRFHPDL